MKATTRDLKQHWDTRYEKAVIEELGWYEEHPEPSLNLINKCQIDKTATILNVGAGASTLMDELLRQGYKNIIANDLSLIALEKLKDRLGEDRHKINWIVDDLTEPIVLNHLEPVDIWHDRAVLHFFTEAKDQETYFNLVKKLVRPNGFVIIATFNLNGATKCSGLPVHRYDQHLLQNKLGRNFELLEAFDYTYQMPSGDTRAYVYTLFKKIAD